MASLKRQGSTTEEPGKRLKKTFNETLIPVVLNSADSNLDFNIEADGLTGHALYEQGFSYCWSGARANIGIRGGKYCFGCKIISEQPVKMEDTPSEQQNVCRVGISRGDDPVGNLGETEHSYGFGGTGKFSNAGRFVNYGESFGIGDTILCSVDLESKPWGTIEFSKNGKRLGMATHFDAGPNGLGVVDSPVKKLSWESALFPHVLLKNVVVEMQFSIEDGLVMEEGYKPWASSVSDEIEVVGPFFSDPKDCEVIMMVGLPAAGKSTWAEKWVKEHPEKRYVLLGTNLALDQMKIPGLLRKKNYGERFDRLMERATGIFNTLLSRAGKISRNYILDQTNVYKNARKRKLKPFACCNNKIAVVVFPKPQELEIRAEKRFREMGKEVPPDAVNEMLANFVLPMSKDMRASDEYFDQVIFTELNRAEAQLHLDEVKCSLAVKPGSDTAYHQGSSVQSDSRVPGYPLSNPNLPFSQETSLQSDYMASSYPSVGSGHAYLGYSSVPGYPLSNSNLPFSQETSLQSDYMASSYPSVGSEHAYLGYSGPTPGFRGVAPGGGWVGSPVPDTQLYQYHSPVNVSTAGYTLSRAESIHHPYPNANTDGRGRGQPAPWRHDHISSSAHTRPAYHPPFGSSAYAASNPQHQYPPPPRPPSPFQYPPPPPWPPSSFR